MKILFLLKTSTHIRHFESVVEMLADRGHEIRIAMPQGRSKVPLPEGLLAHKRVSQTMAPGRRGDEWKDAVHTLRAFTDYVRFLEGPFLPAEKLRTRAFRKLIKSATDEKQTHASARCPACGTKVRDDELGKMMLAVGPKGMKNLNNLLRRAESAVPSDGRHEEFIRAERPDVVLVSPLISLGSREADFVKSAKALGIAVGFPVFSWDNLTTKGIIHVKPDRVFVWNDVQKDEAVRYHDVAAEDVLVLGAPRFDEFFALKVKTPREAFCEKFGVEAGRPILTYLCSSEFVAGGEADFVRTWIDEIRQEPVLKECGILIRPHPRALSEWRKLDFSAWPHVALAMSPRMHTDQLLYDTLYHSAAVVGLNTSAQIEAGIVGRPVYTILAPGFKAGQQGTLHFKYLLASDGGFVEVAATFDEHRAQLADAVAGRYDKNRIRDFVQRFVRPAGIDRPVTPLMADAIEKMAKPRGVSVVTRLLEPPADPPGPVLMRASREPERIRILRVIARMNVGGPAIHVTALHSRLNPQRFESMLVSGSENTDEGSMYDYAAARGVFPTIVPEMRGVATLAPRDGVALARLVRIAREFRPHIVDTHTAKAGFLGRLAAQIAGVPAVVHTYHGHVLHGYYGGLRTTILRGMERGLAQLTDRIIAVSHQIKAELVEHGIAPADRIQVVPLGLELEPFLNCESRRGEFHREFGLSAGTPLIGIVGRVFPIKNHRLFLNTMSSVGSVHPDARFVIVGDGMLRPAMEDLARELGIRERTIFTGWRQDLPTIYAALRILVVSSDNEGTPMSAIEAMASGVPVVATRVGGLPDLVKHGQSGLLVPANDAPAMADAVCQLLSNTTRHDAMGQRARLDAAQFSVERLAADMERLYVDVLKTR